MKKQLTAICLGISIILSGCAPAYRFVKTPDTSDGYTVKKGPAHMSYFTIDAFSQYPKDLRLARKRFRRRRRVVEKYYKEKDPEVFENNFLSIFKIFPTLLLYPLWIIKTIYQEKHPSEKNEKKGIEEYRKEIEEMKQYIKDDCKEETL